MVESHPPLSLLIRHEQPVRFLQLSPGDRRAVERLLLDELEALTAAHGARILELLSGWGAADVLADADAVAASPDEAYAVAEHIGLERIQALFAECVAALGPSYSLRVLGPHATEEFEVACRYCGHYHCDRVCAKLYRDGAHLSLRTVYAGRTWAAGVYLSLEFGSNA